MNRLVNAINHYRKAHTFVEGSDFSKELRWQTELCFSGITEHDFLRETAWVILCSGFREATVRKVFSAISLCFCDWDSAKEITEKAWVCKTTALDVFANAKKIDAILDVCDTISQEGFEEVKIRIAANPLSELRHFPFIGPITSWHLAKNLGFDVAKPDRHLVRCFWQLGLAHFGGLIWPTPWDVKV